MKMAEAGEDYDALMTRMDKLQAAIDAIEGWELERQLERAMQALRCPPGRSCTGPATGLARLCSMQGCSKRIPCGLGLKQPCMLHRRQGAGAAVGSSHARPFAAL